MFGEALLYFTVDAEIDSKHNSFSLDEQRNLPIPGKETYYKISSGEHIVVITSGTGDEWTVRTNVQRKERLKIKLSIQEGNVSDVMYKLSPAPFGVNWYAKKSPGSDK